MSIIHTTEPYTCDTCGYAKYPWRKMPDGGPLQQEYFLNADGTKECANCADGDDPWGPDEIDDPARNGEA